MAKWQERQHVSCGWMLKTRSNVVEYQCSKCKFWAVKWEGTWDYEKCPHCGALMSANDEQVTGKLKEGDEK